MRRRIHPPKSARTASIPPAALLPSAGARSRVRTERSVASIELRAHKRYMAASCTTARGPNQRRGLAEGEVEGDRAGDEARAFQGVLRFFANWPLPWPIEWLS